MAALTADRVVVELEARLGQYEANVARAEQKFDRSMGNIQKSAGRTEAFVARSMGAIGGALAGVSAIALARTFLDIADRAKNMESQLRLATREVGSFGQAQADVNRIATQTRTSINDVATLYASFARGAKDLGINQAQVAQITQTVNQAMLVSGTSSAEAGNAIRQLSQAFASGVLRGDEFNSIMENAPRLAKLLADSLGIPIGSLRAMAEEGDLTADKLVRAFTNREFTAGLQEEVDQMPVTFERAMILLENAAQNTFSAFDRGGGFSEMIASFVSDGATGFGDMATAAEDAGIRIRGEFAGMAAAVQPLIDSVREAINWINSLSAAQEAQGSKEFLLGSAQDIQRWAPDSVFGRAAGRYIQGRSAAEARRRREIGFQGGDAAGIGAFINSVMQSGASPRRAVAAKPKKTGRKTRTPRSPLDADAFAREEAQLNDEILSLKANAVTDASERALAEMKRLEAARLTATTEIQNDKRFTAAQKEKLVALVGTVNALAQAQVLAERDVAVAKDALDERLAGIRNEQDLLRVQADLAATRRERTAIENRILDLAYEQERADLEAVIASKDATAAQKRIAEQRLAMLGQIEAAEREGLNRRGEGPLARYRRDLNNPDRANDEVESAVIDELESVRDSISSAVQKTLGVKNPILAALINSFIEQQLIRPILDGVAGAQGGGGGFLGGIFGTARSIFGFASGGSGVLGGRGGTDRNVLALNGRPIANVSRGETLNVGSKALSGRSSGTTVISAPQFDLRGAVMTRELYADMERISQANAAQAGAAAYQKTMKDVPGRMRGFQRYGK